MTASSSLTDRLHDRGNSTLLASWDAYTHGADGAAIVHAEGVAAAVFPAGPERSVYNNALLERDLDPVARAAAVDALEAIYGAAGVGRFAAWVHESDVGMRSELERRGYELDEVTRSMGAVLDDVGAHADGPGPTDGSWPEYVAFLEASGVPRGLLARARASDFHVRMLREHGRPVAAAIAFDHAGDCGIFNVGTLEHARRRGLGSAVTAHQLHSARARGCSTATLQATAMAESLYARLGFRDLGRILEFVPRGAAA